MPKLGRRSEVTELDYQAIQALTTRDAPFGTEHTPQFKEKIVGGRYVSVLERPYGQNTPRYEKLSLVSEKPNYVDPRTLTDFARRYNKPYMSKVVGRPTHPIAKRPDSKDISSRYPQLPPIEGNRLRNSQISTVFEPEAWTSQYRPGDGPQENGDGQGSPRRPFNSSEASRPNNGFRPLYDPRGSGAYGQRPMQSEPAMNGGVRRSSEDGGVGFSTSRHEVAFSREELVKKLTCLLPKNVFLPDYPIQYAEEDEVRLLEVIAEEMGQHGPLKLRDIYLDIANTCDKSLTGYCQYQDLYHSMNRQMFSMPGDLLQLTAAMFVSCDTLSREVNYEKFLSFLGLALKFSSPRQSNATEDAQRLKSPISQQMDNYFSDSEQAKLASMVEQQLNENDFFIDFSRLETDMLRADRVGKSLLDLRTIMDVCYQQNIPLQSSVLHRILQKCRYNNHDDLYNWRVFIEFLAKARPGQPRTGPVRLRNPSPPPHPPRRHSPASPVNNRTVTPLWRRHEPPPQERHSLAPHYYSHDENTAREEQQSRQDEVISRLEQDIKQLERNYGDIRDMIRPKNDTPWFKNFMEFANALYNQDQRFEGDLPAEDVYRWTKLYNETGSLGFMDHDISKALSNASKGGKVNIHTYLASLGNVANHDKIV